MGFGDQGGPLVVERVDPPTRFAFRWNHPAGEEPSPHNSMLVEFTLVPDGSERTRLKVAESGLELQAGPTPKRTDTPKSTGAGWAPSWTAWPGARENKTG